MGIQETFASNMRSYRKQANLTQEKLAERCGLHRTYIGGIEQRRINVSLKNIGKIASAMELDPAMLLTSSRVMAATAADADASANAATDKRRDLRGGGIKLKTQFKSGDYALCTWTDDGIIIEPIEVTNEDMAMRILCTLASQECQDIVKRYNNVRDLAGLILKGTEEATNATDEEVEGEAGRTGSFDAKKGTGASTCHAMLP